MLGLSSSSIRCGFLWRSSASSSLFVPAYQTWSVICQNSLESSQNSHTCPVDLLQSPAEPPSLIQMRLLLQNKEKRGKAAAIFMWPWLWRLVLRGFCVFIRLVICGASFFFFFLYEAVWSWVIRSSKGSYDYLQSCMTKRSHRLFSANAIMHRSHFCFYWSLLTVTRLHLGPFSLSAQSEAFCVHTVLSFLVGEVCPYMRESEARL